MTFDSQYFANINTKVKNTTTQTSTQTIGIVEERTLCCVCGGNGGAEGVIGADRTLGHLCFGQLQQAEGTRRSLGARLRSMGVGTTEEGGGGGGWWVGVGRCGITVMSASVKCNHR